MKDQPRTVLMILSLTCHSKQEFTLVPILSKGDMSEYDFLKQLVNIFNYAKCKYKVIKVSNKILLKINKQYAYKQTLFDPVKY